ncbi:hypothetical protein N836_32385 [Leptolyngbya sp. Heron Island J]|nr:hypothetical protein N836_32385 [Leptolyngbya sp. Heron Island J]
MVGTPINLLHLIDDNHKVSVSLFTDIFDRGVSSIRVLIRSIDFFYWKVPLALIRDQDFMSPKMLSAETFHGTPVRQKIGPT